MSARTIWKPGRTLRSIKVQAITDALEFCDGNKSTAAAALGISVRTLTDQVRRYPELAAWHQEQPAHLRDQREDRYT